MTVDKLRWRLIGRSVIDDDDLNVLIRLLLQRRKTRGGHLPLVKRDQNDGDVWLATQ